jgi:glycosyltransferase involved in cell wall biosynthesis
MDLVLYAAPAFEAYNPESIERDGAGGSETMAWEMAWRLVERGHRVRVFAHAKNKTGTFRGVEWLDLADFQGTACEVLVSSRVPEVVDAFYRLDAGHKLLWAHDCHYDSRLTQDRASQFDTFLVLTPWHARFWRERYPFTSDRITVTRNGIDPALFERTVARDPHRIIYSSSPDRGLDRAVRAMPSIRARVPDATLHVFYGLTNLLLRAEDTGDRNLLVDAGEVRYLLRTHERFGVVFHERVPQDRLAVEFLKSGVWGYPTSWWETSCITAMQAQAAGCRTVTTARGALVDTAGGAGTMITHDPESPEYLPAYVDAVVEALTRPENGDRAALRAQARQRFSLDGLTDEWDAMLRALV